MVRFKFRKQICVRKLLVMKQLAASLPKNIFLGN